MKKFGLFATIGVATLALAGCNCDCNSKSSQDEDAVLNQRIEYCNELGGTHSLIHSPTAVYGECSFPSGAICEDTTLGTDECDSEAVQDEDAVLNQRIEYCNEHGGTHSLIHSPTAVYGECSFPSGVTCEDTILGTDECDFEPNLENIDTEEKRLNGCEENVQGWMTGMVQGAENINIQWGDESEGGASFVRNGIVKYTKDGSNWSMNVECIADFVDGSISVNFDDEISE